LNNNERHRKAQWRRLEEQFGEVSKFIYMIFIEEEEKQKLLGYVQTRTSMVELCRYLRRRFILKQEQIN
jgi:aminoglycoside phosphotransferase family enzyme